MKLAGDRLRNPDLVARVIVAALLLLLVCCIHYACDGFFNNIFRLAVSGNVRGLVEYLQSFGPWALLVSFVLDVLINAGSVFPSVFLSTANGLVFGLPVGIALSWFAETVGVVLSFLLMRFFFRSEAEKIIEKSKTLRYIDEASGKHGLKWMAIARAMPYFPSGILTAVGAVSAISTKDYVIANLIGKFPSTSLEVIIGHDLVNFHENSRRLCLLVLFVAAVFLAYRKWLGKGTAGKVDRD